MNEHTLRPASIAAAAAVIGGVLIVAVPQHGLNILRLVIVTIAAAAGLYALALLAPPAWWKSPFDARADRRAPGPGSDDVDWIRSTLAGRRQPIEGGPCLPPETLRLLQPLARATLRREGIDAEDDALPQLTRAVLASEPLSHAAWFRTQRPDARESAAVVHRLLDELDRIAAGTYRQRIDTRSPRTP